MQSSTDEWIKKMWHTNTFFKEKLILSHVTIWMNLEDILLSDISQSQKTNISGSYLICRIWKRHSKKQRVDIVSSDGEVRELGIFGQRIHFSYLDRRNKFKDLSFNIVISNTVINNNALCTWKSLRVDVKYSPHKK
jgi:ABC-type transport system involved in Fe-S cluster assembly fused permease/ATPase subunit